MAIQRRSRRRRVAGLVGSLVLVSATGAACGDDGESSSEGATTLRTVDPSGFEEAIHDELLPYAEQLTTFAGAWFDREADGDLVINLTDLAAEPELRRRLPAGGSLRVELVRFTRAELRAASRSIHEAWDDRHPDIDLYALAVQTDTNDLRVEVSPDAVDAVDKAWLVETSGGVPVHVVEGEPDREAGAR
jgi:hypothetical protein